MENEIKLRAVTSLHPAINGEEEKQNRSLMKRIRIAQAEIKDGRKKMCTYPFYITQRLTEPQESHQQN